MRKMVSALLLLSLVFGVAGCSGTSSVPKTETTALSSAETEASVETTVPPTPSPTSSPLILPETQNDSGKVRIQTCSGSRTYKFTSYMITSVEGETAVVDPTSMPKKSVVDINPVAIVSTHGHPDHFDEQFNSSYECPKILFALDDMTTNSFHIFTIASSHADDNIVPDNATNYIAVFEVDGLRIAHMGDIGQTSLTEEQLEKLGKIDIAFMQFDNSYSDMSVENKKGFTLIEQLNPTIIIPTHYSEEAMTMLSDTYGGVTEFDNLLEISPDTLPDGTLHVYHITNTHKYR